MAQGRPLKIGILLTYPKRELKKEELVIHHKEGEDDVVCPDWMKNPPKEFEEFIMPREYWDQGKFKMLRRHPKHHGGKATFGLPADIAIGCYIKETFKDVEVDMILPQDVSLQRLQGNDINFLLIYELLEAFHNDKTLGKPFYNTLKSALKEAGNVYPPLEYQELIYSKIKYYDYLKANDVTIAPTLTMTAEEFAKLEAEGGSDAGLKKITELVRAEGWNKFIAKPVYGQEARDAQFFQSKMLGTHNEKTGWSTHQKNRQGFRHYLKKCMAKYPGIVFQKNIEGFGDLWKCPEMRMYHIGEKYHYSALADRWLKVRRPTSEGGTFDAPMNKLEKVAKGVISKLPGMTMPNGVTLPRLLDRIDLGYLIDGKYSPWVNEVEFAPSLYAQYIPDATCFKMLEGLGEQMVNITRQYVSAGSKKKRSASIALECESPKKVRKLSRTPSRPAKAAESPGKTPKKDIRARSPSPKKSKAPVKPVKKIGRRSVYVPRAAQSP